MPNRNRKRTVFSLRNSFVLAIVLFSCAILYLISKDMSSNAIEEALGNARMKSHNLISKEVKNDTNGFKEIEIVTMQLIVPAFEEHKTYREDLLRSKGLTQNDVGEPIKSHSKRGGKKITKEHLKQPNIYVQSNFDGYILLRSKMEKKKVSNYTGQMIGKLTGQESLVMGLAEDTDPHNFAIFCGSLKQAATPDHGIDGIIFINAPVTQRHISIAEQFNVVIIEYEREKLQPAFLQKYHPSSLRWVFFNQLLQDPAIVDMYKKVLFADVRDTFFQSNPFTYLSGASNFLAFAENLGQSVRDCGWNSGWIRDCFGEDMLQLVSNSTIICSGISMGTTDRMLEYLGVMSGIMMGTSILGGRFPHCERNGVDQGVHNVIMHLGLLKSYTVENELSFPVTHMQSTISAGAYSPSEPTLVTADQYSRQPFAVVHQYDRIHSLQLALAKQYVTWVDVTDFKAMWASTAQCMKYHKVDGFDVLAGKCDSGSFRSMTPSSCCELCDKRPSCTGFAFSEGVCYFKICSEQESVSAIQVYKQPVFQEKPLENLMSAVLASPLGIQ